MLTKRDKIKRLLDSGNPGERAAAQAALGRLTIAPPSPGSPEWCKLMADHQVMVQECAVQIDDPGLSADEVATIRRWSRYVGRPWEDGAENLRRIHRKLNQQETEECIAIR